MALEATHIKFALDIKDIYKTSDLDAYLSGSIYPDSRYVTGVDRSLTHFDELFNINSSEESDFKKGWASHMLCDKVMRDVKTELFSDILLPDQHNQWLQKTAFKILVDIEQFELFNFDDYASLCNYVENPLDEQLELIAKYNEVIRFTYQGKDVISINDCMITWRGLGLDDHVQNELIEMVEKFASDSDIMNKVPQIYPRMIQLVQSI